MHVRIVGVIYRRKYLLTLAVVILLSWNCTPVKEEDELPVLSPEESLTHFQIDKGLVVHIVAAEPFVQAPVAIQFDARGRIWAVEMMSYMPDTEGSEENTNPNGKIVILEDENKDGRIDHREVFLDSLILPRAICFYDDGLLVAEPPNLYFVPINGDDAGAKYLVDSQYAVGGNVEHQPNGLLRGLDNWIYSAKSDTRYRKINGRWVKEHTHFRGQWGITQDDYGRLFYNNNSMNLLGDYFLPGLGAGNLNQYDVSGFNEIIIGDNRTWPIHATPGVNRGYLPKVLNDSLKLKEFTAACGPVIYRGSLLGKEYVGNAFVAGPAANLVKRNILDRDGFKISGKQAYQSKEFLASDDERFRPVSLYNGPGGALYVVDMYRGIIQSAVYLTPYLKKYIVENNLATPLNRGRIYKIMPEGMHPAFPNMSKKTTSELVNLLNSEDAWVSATAQRLLTDNDMLDAIPLLNKQLRDDTPILGKIRSFWTLEGLGQLPDSDIKYFLHSGKIKLQQQAVAAIVSQMDKQNARDWLAQGIVLFEKANPELAPYLGFLAAKAVDYESEAAKSFLLELALRYPDNAYVADAVISGLFGIENVFFKKVKQQLQDTNAVLFQHLQMAAAQAIKNKSKHIVAKQFAKGKLLYMTHCKICHGEHGEGLQALGPPLSGSQWATGDKEKLLAIVLYGLSGPIKVGDKLYKAPEISGEMPGFAQNDSLSDEEIAQILSYIRNAWGNHAESISSKQAQHVREKYKHKKQPFTGEALEKLFSDKIKKQK